MTCTSSSDCSDHGTCVNNQCTCEPTYVGTRCEFPNPCKKNPCANGGECISIPEDGSYYCDCELGYIEPHCKSSDPCLINGNSACLNGATCRNSNDFDFICQCRVPYIGEFCENYDLCELDVEECVEDLSRKEPYCYPCILEANCTWLSVSEYLCGCGADVNHSSCFKPTNYKASGFIRTPHILTTNVNSTNQDNWNPIIPSIAISTCCLYFLILLLILLFLLWKRSKPAHPRLVLACKFDTFEDLTYYLISVETGTQWKAGTKSTVVCVLFGENGKAGPYPLNDKRLKKLGVLQRGQEDNYLVSHSTDLGKLQKVVLWYDPRGHGSESIWFCEKITVRNIKSEKNWIFCTSKWMQAKQGFYEFPAATPEFIERSRTNNNFRHYCYQLIRHHIYLAPFFFKTMKNVTLAFAEYMTYMLILIFLYGLLAAADPDFDPNTQYIFTIVVLDKGSLAAIYCFLLGLFLSILLIITMGNRTPTLLVWKRKPRKSKGKVEIPENVLEQLSTPIPSPSPEINLESVDAATNTNTEIETPAKTKILKRFIIPVRRAKSSDSDYKDDDVFRIPSTNIMKTEEWVDQRAYGKTNLEEMIDDDLVHDYAIEKANIPETLVRYGFTGSLRGIRQQNLDSFIYKTDSFKDSAFLRSAIENDIRDSYEIPVLPKSQTSINGSVESSVSYEEIDVYESDEDLGVTKSDLDLEKSSSNNNNQNSPAANELDSDLAAGDFQRESQIKYDITGQQVEPTLPTKNNVCRQVFCELREMDHFIVGKHARSCVVIGYVICISLIISATVICCIYGVRYGYQRTYDWCTSLAICWLENLLLYQFFKVLILMFIMSRMLNRKKLYNFEQVRIRDRFQMCYLDEQSIAPLTYPLNYIEYLPHQWVSPYFQLHYNT